MGGRIRVLIADDHQLFADALRAFLEKPYEVVAAVHDGRSIIESAVKHSPDVVVVDVSMPLLNGLDAAKRIRKQFPTCHFVFLTMHQDPNLAAAVLELRPVGIVLKHSAGLELVKAIEHVANGKTYLPAQFRSMDWVEVGARVKNGSKQMTSRQRDVLQLLAEGRSMKQAAFYLNLSEKTIEFHKQTIMQVFNLRNNAELVLFAVKQRLISLEM